jgi:hypothetical protein
MAAAAVLERKKIFGFGCGLCGSSEKKSLSTEQQVD